MKYKMADDDSDDDELRADIELLKQQVQSCRATLKKLVSTAETHQHQQFSEQAFDNFVHELLERWQVVRPTAQFELHARQASAAPSCR